MILSVEHNYNAQKIKNANRPPMSATDAVKPYREPSIVLMSMLPHMNIRVLLVTQ